LSNFDADFNEIDWVNSLFKDVPKNDKEVSWRSAEFSQIFAINWQSH
jgi:hypothetical protein